MSRLIYFLLCSFALIVNSTTVQASVCVDSLTQAPRALLLDAPADAYKIRADLIRSAEHHITFVVYHLADDETGREMLALLLDARRRGVAVTMILDDLNNDMSNSMMKHLIDEGVQVRVYHSVTFLNIIKAPESLVRRLHDKFMEVDGKYLITGDRNISGKYFGRNHESTMVSRDVFIIDANTAEKAKKYAEHLFSHAAVSIPSRYQVTLEKIAIQSKALKKAMTDMQGHGAFVSSSMGIWEAQAVEVRGVEFFHDRPEAKTSTEGSIYQVIEGIQNAKASIIIENPYLILTDEVYEALKNAADRGVCITAYTNSRVSLDVPFIQESLDESKRRLAFLGATVWEHPGKEAMKVSRKQKFTFKNPRAKKFYRNLRKWMTDAQGSSLHSKTMIIDHETAFVMSVNLDPRSQMLNLEVGAIIHDKEFANILLKSILSTQEKIGYILYADHGLVLWREGGNIFLKAANKITRGQQ